MAILENFLCFDLDTGGYFIGGFGMFLSLGLVSLSGYRLMSVKDMILFTVSGAEVFIYTVYFITCIMLIIGTSKRNQNIVFPALPSSVLVLISIIVNLVFLSWPYIPLGIYIVYTILCILSLCQLFREEKIRQSVHGYHPARQQE
ncbi:hypothetical protein PVAND_015959 [Polypedilum vanderplanki]|uniref:Uncharacterized protein n=1 Tax=Polypedilum vanderplanki TaxID=319348 RepID=A0A9J6BE76_POLVA|nr:hypothetical protein PVAND_015959 [Polypedilum vanderplanki]